MWIFAFLNWTDACLGRSLSIWAAAFTPAFLSLATPQRTNTDFEEMYLNWFGNLAPRSFAILEAISCRAIIGRMAWDRLRSDPNVWTSLGSVRRRMLSAPMSLSNGASWPKR